MLNRRTSLAAGLSLAFAPVLAQAEIPVAFRWRGFQVDISAVPERRRNAIAAGIRQQIDLVESLAIRDDVKTWFRGVRITVDPALNMPGRYRAGQLTMDDRVPPAENPVLLHELLHGYQPHLPGGGRNAVLVAAFEAARTSGDWPTDAYMLSNLQEFFAMTASVMLWGRAARPPSTRARLTQAMPDYTAWLAEAFGLRV